MIKHDITGAHIFTLRILLLVAKISVTGVVPVFDRLKNQL